MTFSIFPARWTALLLFLILSLPAAVVFAQPALSDAQINRLMDSTFEVMANNYIEPARVPQLKALFHSKRELGHYQGLTTLSAFAKQFGDDLRQVSGDKHLSLYTVNPHEEITYILSHPEGKLTYNYAFECVRYLPGNIGYLKFNKFHPSDDAKRVVDSAFAFLAQSAGMIIDLRDTVGGSPALVQYMLSYFINTGTPLWYVEDANGKVVDDNLAVAVTASVPFADDYPIWVLTSSNTASASEIFAGVLQANNKAVIVGDVTAGAGFYVGVRHITDELIFRISLMKPVISATGSNWEKTGIQPDIAVPAMDALDTARELAFETVRSSL